MANAYDFSFVEADVGGYYAANKPHVNAIVKKCLTTFSNVKKNFYTELKQWFKDASKLEFKCGSASNLMKYIVAFTLLLKEKEKSWSPPSVFGLIVPDLVLQHQQEDIQPYQGIPSSDEEEDPRGNDSQQEDGNANAIPTDLATIMARMEDRITRKLLSSCNANGTVNAHGRGQRQSAMSQILAEDGEYDEEGLLHKQDEHAEKCDVDDPDILYFPLLWMDKAQTSTADLRQLMTSLKDATRLRNPKNKSEQHQIDHLLQVANLLFKGKNADACAHIGYRIHFLLKSTTNHLGQAIDYYEHLVKSKRPQKEREADLAAKIPKGMAGKQAAFLGQQLKGPHDKEHGKRGAGAGQQGEASQQGASKEWRGGRQGRGPG